MEEIWKLSAVDMARAVRCKDLSALEVCEAHLHRISEVNPAINAIVQPCRDEALETARRVDDAIARGDEVGPLCGVPVTIKVNVDQAGYATTNGLRLLENATAEKDSPVVANLLRAGAVIVGRTNTPAFSLRWFTNNGLHGQTLNPRHRDLTPGGSSGGASAAVAAGLCAIGHGTDIAGSVRYPAYACGLHGLRPTIGRVPAFNASAPERFIGAQLMAVSGPLARSIDDLELAFHAMAAADARDPWYVPAPLTSDSWPKRAALVVAPDGMAVSSEVEAALQAAAETLKTAGWTVAEIPCPPMRAAADINATLWMAETQVSAKEMIAREAEPDSQFVFEQMSADVGPVGFDDLMNALQARATLVRQWALFLQDYPVLLCPISGELPFAQQQDVASPEAFAAIMEAQLTQRALPALGLPALAVATGCVGHTPVGVQLVGPKFREDILLDAGRDIAGAHPPVDVVCPQWN